MLMYWQCVNIESKHIAWFNNAEVLIFVDLST